MALMNFESRAYETENMRRMLINQTQNTYHELVFLYRKKKLLAENRNTLESIVSISRSLVSVNKMNSSQLLKLEAGMSQLDSEILEVSAMISKTESAMENLSTVKPEENLIEVGSLSPEEISIPVLPGDSSHPLIQNSQAVLEKARANKSHEESKYFPSVTLSAEYMLREPVDGSAMGGDDMISLRVTAPLPLFFVIKETRSVMAAEEGILQARQNLEQVKLALKTAWEGEYEMAMRNREVYARYRNEVLPRFLASYKAQLGSLASGAVSLLDVLDAYRDYLEVSIKEAGIYRDLQKSIAMLKYLEGKNEK
jgi:outer membrane protein TolC